MTEASSSADLLNNLAHEFAERFRRGERPALNEYTDKYPELATDIRELFPAMVAMEQLGEPTGAGGLNPLSRVTAPTPMPQQLGEFRILAEVARGGMGIVYEAVQEPLGRHVALKVLPFQSLITGNHVERFQREARAAANLHHTNIVPVFAVGECQGIHYYAMQFIHGQSLESVLRELRRLRRVKSNDKSEPPDATRRDGPHDDLSFSLATGMMSGQFVGSKAPSPPAHLPPKERDPERAPTDKSPRTPAPLSSAAVPSNLGAASDISHTLRHSTLSGQTHHQYFRTVARLGMQVAEALVYAHGQGVLHRDIKPSNLLLDTQGTVWVTDFGLAKAVDSEDLTATGDIVGTLRYMAPERFQGQADNRSDVYGLGVTLYELLTLQPVHAERDRARLVEVILRVEPVRPRKLDPHVPRDLETIVLKAIAKEPAQRYGLAAELSEDLRRFLADRPVRARRITPWEQTIRWCFRNPMVASLSAMVAALLVAVAGVAFFDDARIRRELNEKVLAEAETTKANQEARRRLYNSLVAQARASRFSRRMGQRFDSLRALADATKIAQELNLDGDAFLELRNEAIAAMALPDVREIARSTNPGPANIQEGSCIDVTSDLERYASVDRQWRVSVRRMSDNEEIYAIPGVDFKWCRGEFSRDGQFLKLYAHNHCQLWRLTSGGPKLVVEPAEEPAWDVASAIRPDSRELAVAFKNGSIGIYDLPSGRELRRLSGNLVARALAYHPKEHLLAVAGTEAVQIRATDTGAEIGSEFHYAWNDFPCVQWRPDGKALAAAGGVNDRAIHLWDVATGKEIGKLEGHKSEGIHFTFNHRGDLLVSNSWDATLRFWDSRTFKQLFSVPVGDYGLVFNSDDSRFGVISSSGRPVAIYEIAHGGEYRTLARDPALGNSARQSQVILPTLDRGLLVVGTGDGVEFFDPASGRELGFVKRSERVGVLDAPGELVTGDGGGLFQWPIWSDPGGLLHVGPARRFASPTRHWLACSRDGRVMASAQRWGAWVFRRDRPEQRLTLAADQDVRHVAVSPDGQWVVTDCSPVVKIWHAGNGELVKEFPASYSLKSSRFSPDGQWLAINEVQLSLWKVDSWQQRWTFDANRGETPAFSPDSRLLAFETGPGVVRLVDLQTGRDIARLEDPYQDRANLLDFTPDGTMLVAGSNDSFSLHVWDLRAIRRQLAEMGLDRDLPELPSTSKTQGVPPDQGAPGVPPDAEAAKTSKISKTSEVSIQIDPGDLTARERYSFILTFFPFDAEVYYERGLTYARYGQWAEARSDFTQAMNLWRKTSEVFKTSEVSTKLDSTPSSKHGFVDALTQLANAEYMLRDWSRAADDYTAAIKLKPKDALLWHRRAHCSEYLNRLEEALPDFTKSLELNPDKESFWNCRAHLYTRLNQWDRAVDDYSRVIELKADSAEARSSRALAYCAQGEWEKAAADFARVVELNPNDHYPLYLGAPLRLQIGDTEGYRSICREMLKRFGTTDNPMIAERVAKTCSLAPEAVSDFGPVLKLADRAVVGMEKNGLYRWFVLAKGLAKGLAEHRGGHYAGAVDWLVRFAPRIDGNPPDATAFAVLAMAKYRLSGGRQPPEQANGNSTPGADATRLAEEARAALNQAEAILSQKMPDPKAGRPYGQDFHDWLHARILTQEAKGLLGPEMKINPKAIERAKEVP